MHFGVRNTEEETFAVLDRALELGINFVDTANVYGQGISETLLGRWIKAAPGRRDRVVVATKAYSKVDPDDWPNHAAGWSTHRVRRHLEDSLRRLQFDHVDLFQCHHLDRQVGLDEFWHTMDLARDRGQILYPGTSNFPGWALARYQAHAASRGRPGLISEQSMLSLLCRYAELEVLPSAQAHGIGVIPYMPLAGGMLSGNPGPAAGSRTLQAAQEYGLVPGADNPALQAFGRLAADHGVPPNALALAWVLSRPAVTSVIVGVRTVDHLDGLEAAAELTLDAATLRRLDELFPPAVGRPLRPGKPGPEAYAW